MMPSRSKPPTLFKREPASIESVVPLSTDPESAANYSGLMDVTSPSNLGYWVKCPLPVYTGLSVLYKTNNQTKRLRQRPRYDEPREVKHKRRELADVLGKISVEYSDELDDRRTELVNEIHAGSNAYEDVFHAEQCRWLAMFAIDFEGFPPKFPVPDPSNPDSYIVLYEEYEDLYYWLLDRGYDEALRESLGNGHATSS